MTTQEIAQITYNQVRKETLRAMGHGWRYANWR